MTFHLLKKEFSLCLHATCILFLLFSAFVFIPNYPYEVMYFFSGLSVFFVSLSARENGDIAFSCTMPVRKKEVALARILFCAVFQVALLLLTGVTVAIKEAFFPAPAQINFAGSTANLALLGHGGVLLGLFNLIFFPWHFKNPVKVGVPFLVGAIAQFLLIAILIVLRFVCPVYSDMLVTPDPQNMGVKAIFFCAGIIFYAGATALAAYLSMRRFEKTDL